MRKAAAVLGGVTFAVAAAAMADQDQGSSRNLKGTYALTGSAGCVFAADFSNLAPIGHASANSFSSNGILNFNADGTGSMATRVVAVGDPDPGDSGATSAIDTTSTFTYIVADDGTFNFDQGQVNSSFVAGPRAGQHTQTTGIPTQVGHVSGNKGALVFGSFDPVVETVTNVDGPSAGQSTKRICYRSNTAVRIDSDSDH
jgi:hypothetical protein